MCSFSNINPARTGTSSTPRKAQNITPASLPQNNPPEGSHTITTIFTKNLQERLDNTIQEPFLFGICVFVGVDPIHYWHGVTFYPNIPKCTIKLYYFYYFEMFYE
jgi:hypothetical protein